MIFHKKQTVRVLVKGGILTPTNFLRILKVARLAGNEQVHFGSREDLLFDVMATKMNQVNESFSNLNIDYVIHGKKGTKIQNIVSSYVACDLAASTKWLSSGNLLQVLEIFKYRPSLRINISDPEQNMVPLMFGNLNFIASSIQHYWYLFIRRNETETPQRWPVLVLSSDIGVLSQAIESRWQGALDIFDLFESIQAKLNLNIRRIEADLSLEFKYPHDYEGFGKMYNSQNYWAGFYWRNNAYEIDFLEELCQLCINTSISKICITPWKSFLVKDIREKDLIQWHRLLGRFGITMRHSSFDLNWHLPFNDKIAFRLKRKIVKSFDKVDVCVHGLTFGIKTKAEPDFYSIKIDRKPGLRFLKGFDIFATYSIYYAKDFNPNLCEYSEYATKVPRYRVAESLRALTLKFYSQLKKTSEPVKPQIVSEIKKQMVFQCKSCLSIYDENKGVLSLNIEAGTRFISLPESFCCQTCGAPKSDFKQVYFENILKAALS